MRRRTAVAFVAVFVVLAGGGAYAVVGTDPGGTLSELWVSDTPRNNTVNHHGVGANAGVVVAPTSERRGSAALSRESCSLVRLAPENGAVRWRWAVPPERCFIHALTRPTVADLDGDDRQEILAGTTENATVVLGADGRERFRVPMGTYGYAPPTVADLRGDDAPEIVASDIQGGIVVATNDGEVRWRGNVSGSVWDAPIVADIAGDGTPEVVVGSSEETVAFAADGSVLWRRPVSGNDVAVASIGSGPSVIAVGFDGVVSLDGTTGERGWSRSLSGSPSMASVGDGDGDGTPEAYVSVPGSVVAALDATDGTEEWRTRLVAGSEGATPPPVLADLTGDGAPELVAATAGGTVAALDTVDGAELAAYERDVPVWTAVTAADLTDDPGAEILVKYGDGRTVALAYEE